MTELAKGTVLFDSVCPVSTPERLALFSKGTADPNPLHVDESFAKRAGFRTVVQQGPMTTAHFARLLREKVGDRLKVLDVTFTAPVHPGDALRMTATVEDIGPQVRISLAAQKQDGTPTAKGYALVDP
ncbi:MAG: MaoC family dehydratase [Alphaproteobacteria bacterium]